jgi:hypothetical protein
VPPSQLTTEEIHWLLKENPENKISYQESLDEVQHHYKLVNQNIFCLLLN